MPPRTGGRDGNSAAVQQSNPTPPAYPMFGVEGKLAGLLGSQLPLLPRHMPASLTSLSRASMVRDVAGASAEEHSCFTPSAAVTTAEFTA
jgi:hypothetical protein